MSAMGQQSFGDYAAAFHAEGAIHVPQALSADAFALVEAAFASRLASSAEFYPDSSATFRSATGDSSAEPVFRRLLRETPVGDVAAALFESGPVWFTDEQLFYKQGDKAATGARRTPWHQDASFFPYRGRKQAVVWMALDPVPKDCALEFVRGSHRGILYSTAKFGGDDDTAPLYPETALPRLPDIESERERWDIISWATEPGDLVIFHPAMLHGGGATRPGGRRRSLSLRLAGDDVVRAEHTDAAPQYDSFLDRYWALPPGAPIVSARPMQVRPWDSSRARTRY
jgi:ectoine hydroxylase-related dioxygenase (phytanoyl-CoA dioxygenase family)